MESVNCEGLLISIVVKSEMESIDYCQLRSVKIFSCWFQHCSLRTVEWDVIS